MSKQMNALSKLLACACVAAFLGIGCGGDDDSGNTTMEGGAGDGAFATGGTSANPGTGGSTGSGGSGTMTGSTGGMGASGSGGHGTGGTTGSGGASSQTCGAQSCAGTCCGNECITDLDTNEAHCGSCGKACKSGEKCTDGQCTSMPRTCDTGDEDGGASTANGCLPNEKCISVDGAEGECRCGSGSGCAENETCTKAGKCMCGKNAACGTGEACCDGDCIDVLSDESNCGECGHECATGATCSSGECNCDVAGRVECNGKCVALDTNSNCGECGTACEAPSTCRDPSGPRDLGCYCPNVNEVPCNGVCVALGTTDNCGSCGDACTSPANVCTGGACACPIDGQTACGNTCVNLRTGNNTAASGDPSKIENCGKCGVTCLDGAACTNGQCACTSASTTDMFCDEDPVSGKTDGHYMCIEVKTTKNCGACGNACLDDSECRGASPMNAPSDFSCVCIGDDAGKTHCAGIGCRSLNNDEENCGQCGRACPDNVNCVAGSCDCPGGASVESCKVDGEATCVDTDTDKNNCGGCGVKCSPGETCCGGDCIDPDTGYDTNLHHCGSCGHDCDDEGCGILGLQSCNRCTNGQCTRN